MSNPIEEKDNTIEEPLLREKVDEEGVKIPPKRKVKDKKPPTEKQLLSLANAREINKAKIKQTKDLKDDVENRVLVELKKEQVKAEKDRLKAERDKIKEEVRLELEAERIKIPPRPPTPSPPPSPPPQKRTFTFH